MVWLENILVIAGISLDMLASMEVQGAMLQKIQKKKLFAVTTLVVLLQCIFFYGGCLIGFGLEKFLGISNPHRAGYLLSVIIFLLLGVRLMVKAIRSEFVDECRREITVRQYVQIIAVSSVYTIFAGLACKLIGSNLWFMFFMIILFSFFAVFCGIYVGYNFGFEAKNKIYIIGAIVLFLAGVTILLGNVILV